MGEGLEKLLHNCLYFTANSLARRISQLAEEEFRFSGLSPSHAFLLMLVNDKPGINQKELAAALNLAPSTVTRFVDSLRVPKALVERRTEGRTARIFPTEQGLEMGESIARCWHNLFERYSKALGETEGRALSAAIDRAAEELKD